MRTVSPSLPSFIFTLVSPSLSWIWQSAVKYATCGTDYNLLLIIYAWQSVNQGLNAPAPEHLFCLDFYAIKISVDFPKRLRLSVFNRQSKSQRIGFLHLSASACAIMLFLSKYSLYRSTLLSILLIFGFRSVHTYLSLLPLLLHLLH